MIITKREDGRFVIRYEQGELLRRGRGIRSGTVFLFEGRQYRAGEVDSYYNGELSYVAFAQLKNE